MEKQIDEQMSLTIIREAIENARSNFRDNGFFYLLWGWLVLIASLLDFSLIRFVSTPMHWLGWPIIMTIGGFVSGIYGYRLGKKSTVRTFVDTAIMFLWMGFGVSIVLIIIATIINQISWFYTNPVLIIFYGLGTVVSGGILKFKPLIVGGALAWIIGFITFGIHSEIQLLMIGLAITVSYLVPGYMLKIRNNGHV